MQTEAFVGKAMGDAAGFMATLMAAMGDKLGLFRALASKSFTSSELAEKTGLNERYVREWCRGMTVAGYIEHDPALDRFKLPAEHVPVLAQEGGPMFFGGMYQESLGALPNLPAVIEAFQKGGGVPISAYGHEFWCGVTRFTRGWFENLLVPVWVPSIPGLKEKLEAGATWADVGCGHGYALVKLAQAFPKSRFVGFDAHGPNIETASKTAADAKVADRVRYVALDASSGLPEKYDVISTFDVVHDAVDPTGMLRSIRQGLADKGVYLCLEVNCSDKLEEMMGPLGTAFHGFSLMFCMTTSLARGGAGLGTCGLPEKRLGELATDAGFGACRKVPLDNPFNALYELRG